MIPIAAFVVSIVVLLVQYAQWRTANQKVVVDLMIGGSKFISNW